MKNALAKTEKKANLLLQFNNGELVKAQAIKLMGYDSVGAYLFETQEGEIFNTSKNAFPVHTWNSSPGVKREHFYLNVEKIG